MWQNKFLSTQIEKMVGSGLFGLILTLYVVSVPFSGISLIICIIPVIVLDVFAANSFSWKIHDWTWEERLGDLFSILAVAGLGYLRLYIGSANGNMMPVWVQCVMGFILIDTCGYWIHYLAHYNKFLWRLHRVHHSRSSPSILNASYEHLADAIFRLMIPGFVLVALNFDKAIIEMVSCLTAMCGAFSHVNLKVRIPVPLNWLLINPITHRLHHHKNEVAVNNGNITHLWDHIMRTYTLYEMKPDEYGLTSEQQISDSPANILIAPDK